MQRMPHFGWLVGSEDLWFLHVSPFLRVADSHSISLASVPSFAIAWLEASPLLVTTMCPRLEVLWNLGEIHKVYENVKHLYKRNAVRIARTETATWWYKWSGGREPSWKKWWWERSRDGQCIDSVKLHLGSWAQPCCWKDLKLVLHIDKRWVR